MLGMKTPLSLACWKRRSSPSPSAPPQHYGTKQTGAGGWERKVPMRMRLPAASPPAHLLAGEARGVPVPPREAAAIQRGFLPGSLPSVSPTLRGIHGADPSHHRAGGAAVRGGPARPPRCPSRGPSPGAPASAGHPWGGEGTGPHPGAVLRSIGVWRCGWIVRRGAHAGGSGGHLLCLLFWVSRNKGGWAFCSVWTSASFISGLNSWIPSCFRSEPWEG